MHVLGGWGTKKTGGRCTSLGLCESKPQHTRASRSHSRTTRSHRRSAPPVNTYRRSCLSVNSVGLVFASQIRGPGPARGWWPLKIRIAGGTNRFYPWSGLGPFFRSLFGPPGCIRHLACTQPYPLKKTRFFLKTQKHPSGLCGPLVLSLKKENKEVISEMIDEENELLLLFFFLHSSLISFLHYFAAHSFLFLAGGLSFLEVMNFIHITTRERGSPMNHEAMM